MRILLGCFFLLGASQGAAWSYQSLEDEMDDQITHRLTLEADRVVTNLGIDSRPLLSIECELKPKHVRLVFYPGFMVEVKYTENEILQAMGDPRFLWETFVQLRLDSAKPKTYSFSPSDTVNEGAAEAVFKGNPRKLHKQFLKSKKLLVRLNSLAGEQETFGFDLSGLDESMNQLRESCGLKRY